MYKKYLKRIIDFTASLFGLILLGPIFIFITVGLFFANEGKPFFFQKRPGLHGKIFRIVKFKTMNDKRDAQGKLLPDVDRLTPIGVFVRKTSLDEIPQLFNVLMGERYKMATKETKAVLRGEYGQTVQPFNKEVQDKVIPGEEVITCRPADLIPNELEKIESEMKEWKQQDEDILTYALFPQVAVDFFKYRQAQQDKVDMSVADTKNAAYPV